MSEISLSPDSPEMHWARSRALNLIAGRLADLKGTDLDAFMSDLLQKEISGHRTSAEILALAYVFTEISAILVSMFVNRETLGDGARDWTELDVLRHIESVMQPR